MPRGVAGEPDIVILPDPAAVSQAAAEVFAAVVGQAVAARGRADVATTGGSTPAGLYRRLLEPPLRASVPWSLLHLWFGDERFVRRGDLLANVRIVDEVLVGGADRRDGAGVLPLSAEHVHAVPVDDALAAGEGPGWAARRYAREIRRWVPRTSAGLPRFDLVIVGVGPDGHVLSVFPGSAATASRAVAMAAPAPTHVEPRVERITLSPRILDQAGALLVVVYGEAKAAIVHAVLDGPRRERELPAQRARRAGATWLLDEAAARELTRRA